MTLRKNGLNWLLFIVLSFIWGSSFILMKEGLQSLSAYQVASVRIICSGLVLAPVAVRCPVSYTHLDVYKRQGKNRMPRIIYLKYEASCPIKFKL